jgi:hypothetical protein
MHRQAFPILGFPGGPIVNTAALAALALLAIPRSMIKGHWFLSLVASSDLHRYGYTIRHWVRLKDGACVDEYNPYPPRKLPRLTATTYAQQVAIHEAMGLNLVGRGEQWVDYKGPGLFDEFLKDAAACSSSSAPPITPPGTS